MHLEHFSFTHVGTRTHNDDYAAMKTFQDDHCFVVADGLGSYKGSDLAAKYFCEDLTFLFPNYDVALHSEPSPTLHQWIKDAQQRMSVKLKEKKYTTASTTCVIAVINASQTLFAYIGDSRIYLIENNQILWRSRDHSYVEELVEAHGLTEQEAKHHPLRNVITNTVNSDLSPKPTITLFPALKPGQGIVLCSDGFWEHATDQDMFALLKAPKLDEGIQHCVEKILKIPKNLDNITVTAIRISK